MRPAAAPKQLAIALIRGYQRCLSPLLTPSCRFEPSCSQYGVEALRERGLLRGSLQTGWRLLRCNPLNGGGYDPVRPPSGTAGAGHDGAARKTEVLER